MPKAKKRVGLLSRIDKGTATTLGIVLASAVTTWVGSCRTNERVDATAALAVSGAEVDAGAVDSIASHLKRIEALEKAVKLLQVRKRVLVVDTLRVNVVVHKKRGWLSWLTAPPTK
jgi:hypothetical protein